MPAIITDETTLDLLLRRHHGAVNIPLQLAAEYFGLSVQTLRSRATPSARKAGTPPVPFPTFKTGSRRFVEIRDLAQAIDFARSSAYKSQRPSKIEQVGVRDATQGRVK